MAFDMKKWAKGTRGASRTEAERQGRDLERSVMNDKVERDLSEAWEDLKAADRALDAGSDPSARRKKDTALRDLEQAIAQAKKYGHDVSDWQRRLEGMKG